MNTDTDFRCALCKTAHEEIKRFNSVFYGVPIASRRSRR